jgi:hypothetical protein
MVAVDQGTTAERAARRSCVSTPARRGITYPYARGADGRLVHIGSYVRGMQASCLGCGDPMVGRVGSRIQKHFAHRHDGGASCSQETALHAAAKQYISEAFLAAKAANAPYLLRWPCAVCGKAREANLPATSERVVSEDTIVEGVRSDLAFHGRRPFAVEVVVTHPPEQQTLDRYQAAGVPMFVLRPVWDTIGRLSAVVDAQLAYFVDDTKCDNCRRLREERESKERERTLVLGRLAEVLRIAVQGPATLRPWAADARGHTLYPRIAATVHDTGRRLLAAGFRQTQSKPWLFVLNARGIGSFFANLGGTPEVPIWSDPTPLLHWRFERAVAPAHEKPTVDAVRDYLAARNVQVRTSFYSPY